MEKHHKSLSLTVEEWTIRLGLHVRDLRLRHNVTQAELARRANIDRTTVARIERGDGGNLRSLVQIARALGREEWLDSFAPPVPAVSPMQLLAERRESDGRRLRARPSPSVPAP